MNNLNVQFVIIAKCLLRTYSCVTMPDAVNTTVNGKYKKLGGVIYRGVPTALEYMKSIIYVSSISCDSSVP